MKKNLVRELLTPALAIGLVLAVPQTFAATVTFGSPEKNQAYVLEYFNGGTDSQGASGVNYGIEFGKNAESLTAGYSGTGGTGTGKFENVPSGASGVLYFASTSSATSTAPVDVLNVAQGFTRLSFNYSLYGNSSTYAANDTVSLYSGLNGTGSLLGTLNLGASGTPVSCTSTRDYFCSWSQASLQNFLGTGAVAESAVFGGNAAVYTEFDNVQVSPVPLPGALLLLMSGMGGLGALVRRRPAAV